ncbi:hypothetical protein GCM10011609_87600 [Lentzea pudingi]|uniref:DUF4158 domain-containing protein n=1 Tax=Lentzea pudingi TaxID=1789439 RepID=A0ABQ2IUQ8_9PSEU|nr:DUF4158 domain-containing protein [Lentzea pudingi]GGN30065.1 hypothetical protein GCM10011609_87600 [Lentzea pudingi]
MEFVAELVKVDPVEFGKYSFHNRTAEYHRAQVREALGLHPATVEDQQRWMEWLAAEQCPVEQNRDRLEVALRQRCRSESAEPPSGGRIERVIGSALRQHETAFAALIVDRLGLALCAAMQTLLESEGFLAEAKADPGPLGLDTLLGEIAKLRTVRGLGLPAEVFAWVSDRLVAAWRSRAARMFPSDFAECSAPGAVHAAGGVVLGRQTEITDALVGLLVDLVHKINARAERRVEKELLGEMTTVPGKKGIFLKMINAVLDHSDEPVREAVGSVVPGGARWGEDTAQTGQGAPRWQPGGARAGAVPAARLLHHHYRRMLAPVLAALNFQCNNTACRPGDGRRQTARLLRGGGRQGQGLRARRQSADRGCRPEGVAGRGHRRERPG